MKTGTRAQKGNKIHLTKLGLTIIRAYLLMQPEIQDN
jgi:hypothetical protein